MSDIESSEVAKPVNAIAALLTTAAILVLLYWVRLALAPFVIAGVSAFVLAPVADRLAAVAGIRRGLAGFLVFLVVAAGLGVLMWLAAAPTMAEASHVATDLQPIIERSASRLLGDAPVTLLGQKTSAAEIAAAATSSLRNTLEQTSNLVTLLGIVFGGMFGFFLTLTLFAYFLASGGNLVTGFVRLLPPHWRGGAQVILSRLSPLLWRYFVGVGCVVIYAGSAAYVGLGLFLRLRHAPLLAALTGVLEILPVVGPGLSAALGGVAALQQAKSATEVLMYAVYATALRLSIDQLVGPLVLGKAARLHPTVVIFCFLAGGLLFGVPGVVLAAPAALAVRVALATIYREWPADTEPPLTLNSRGAATDGSHSS